MTKLMSITIIGLIGMSTVFTAADATAQNEAERVELSGTFEKKADDSIIFVDQDDKKYFVIKGLHEKAAPHIGKQVDLTAKVKPTKSGKGMLMVYIIKIKPAN